MIHTLDNRYNWYEVKLPVNKTQVTYYFRGLTHKEVKSVRALITAGREFEAEDFILNSVVKSEVEHDWPNTSPGVVDQLIKSVYRVSGLGEHGMQLYDRAVKHLDTFDGGLELVATWLLPGITLELLDNADPYTRAKYLIGAKTVFELLYERPLGSVFLLGEKERMRFNPQQGPQQMGSNHSTTPGAFTQVNPVDGFNVKMSNESGSLPDSIPNEWIADSTKSKFNPNRIR